MGAYHPECPQRLKAIEDNLLASGLMNQLQQYDAPLATVEQLARAHTPNYIKNIQSTSPESGLAYLDPDTTMNPHSLNAALRAAGATVMAVDLILSQQVKNVFCAVRPPGHHAESARAMGFCLFNNVAVGVAHAIVLQSLILMFTMVMAPKIFFVMTLGLCCVPPFSIRIIPIAARKRSASILLTFHFLLAATEQPSARR